MSTVLISSAGRRGELVTIFKQTLDGTGRVLTADMSPLSSAGLLGDGHHLVPRLSDPDFVEQMVGLCAEQGVKHIIPTIDTELPLYASAQAHFAAEGITVWVSSPETIDIARDKRLTHQFLRESGFPCPAQRDLGAEEPLPFPVVAKPARGSSSIGLLRAHDATALATLDTSLDYVLEEIVPGDEFTVDCLVDSAGKCRVTVPRRRLEVRAGEVSKGWVQRNLEVERLARDVVEALPGAFGVLNVQIFFDETTGRLAVIEINARFGGGFPLSFAAGADLPGWMLRHLNGDDDQPAPTWRPDVVMLRYDQGVYIDAADLGLSL